jgi:hypothetical protein
MKKKDEHYVDNAEFYKLLLRNKEIIVTCFYDDIKDIDFTKGVDKLTFKKQLDKYEKFLIKTKVPKIKWQLLKDKQIEALRIKTIKHRKNKKLMYLVRNTDNALPEIVEYKRIQNKLGIIFLDICKGVLTKPNFINYTWDRKDDMTSEATFHMSRYVLLFDTEQNNPFAYFTTVCNRAFLQCINKQNKYTDKFQPLIYIENFHKLNLMAEDEWD